MANILLARIDNRLVHGQVGVTWTKTINANLIVVADDEVATDKLQQDLMSIVADSSGVGIRFFSIAKTIEVIHKAADSQHIFIVTKSPNEMRRLIEGNVPIKTVNIGNMHFSNGKRALSKKVYVDDQDFEDLKYIKSQGVNVYIQDIPGDIKEEFE